MGLCAARCGGDDALSTPRPPVVVAQADFIANAVRYIRLVTPTQAVHVVGPDGRLVMAMATAYVPDPPRIDD